PARLFLHRDPLAGDLLAGRDHLAHGVASPVSKVEEARLPGLQRADVRIGEIDVVDVIADARSVRGRVIRAEDLRRLRFPEGNPEDVRDQVCLDPMVLAETFAGSGGVEIPEGHELEAVNALIPLEDA